MFGRLAKGSLLVLASVLVGLLVAELALRLAGVSHPSFFVADPDRGAALRPGAEGWQRKEGVAHVRINSRGLRDREHPLAKPPATFRIAVLGDSYTFASHVAADETFAAVLGRELAACPAFAGREVETINFGVSGYGTTESLLTLRHHVWQYSPDLVLLAFFTGNDVTDNSAEISGRRGTPFFRLEGDTLVLDRSFRGAPAFRFRTSRLGRVLYAVVDHSRVLQVVNQAKLALTRRARLRAANESFRDGPTGIEAGIDNAVYRPPESREWREAWRLTERLLETMHREVREHGAEFLLVTLSTGVQVHPDAALRQRFMDELGIDEILYPDERIRAFAERAAIPVLVLAPEFQRHARETRRELHGFANSRPGFGHWNESGHELGGRMMAARICRDHSGAEATVARRES